MPKLPKISIIIPTFQQGRFIARTLESIVSQGYGDLEIIVMDGGSTDETAEIIARYREHIAIYISGKDDGQSDAIRRGFEQATGEVITWLNSDDTYTPGTLDAVGQFFLTHPGCRFVYGDRDMIDESDRVIARRRQPDFNMGVMLYCHMTVPQMSAFWRRDLYEEAGGMDPAFRFCMDYDLFVRMARISPPVRLPVVLANFRLHGESKTSNLEDVRRAEDALIHARYCRFKPGTAAFAFARSYFYIVLVLIMARNGGLMERVRVRISGTVRGNTRVDR
jgi:glycosyltransferase involved in cell wall biosynthesis